jgi:hypothetical protein
MNGLVRRKTATAAPIPLRRELSLSDWIAAENDLVCVTCARMSTIMRKAPVYFVAAERPMHIPE